MSVSAVYADATSWDVDRPWLPQPCDTPDAYAWFLVYLSLPQPRDLRDLRRAGCPIEVVRLEALSINACWPERAEAYDAHLAGVRLATIEAEVESLAAGHARRMSAIRAVTDLGAAEVRRLTKAAAKLGDYPGSIRPELAVRAVVHGVRTEALLLGAVPPGTQPGDEEADLSDLSDEEVERLAELQRKAERGRK